MSIASTLLGNIGIRARAQEFPIPTNGLQLWLDATNLDSYQGTGTTWSDLSGNGYDFTLSDAAAFVAASGSIPAHMNFESQISRRLVNGTMTNVPNATNGTIVIFSTIKNITNNWRTLTRGEPGAPDHQVIIENGSNDLGMYDNNGGAFQDSGFDINSVQVIQLHLTCMHGNYLKVLHTINTFTIQTQAQFLELLLMPTQPSIMDSLLSAVITAI